MVVENGFAAHSTVRLGKMGKFTKKIGLNQKPPATPQPKV
jgi:hypothetical protein